MAGDEKGGAGLPHHHQEADGPQRRQEESREGPLPHSDLAQYCQICGKVAEVILGSDFTHTIVHLSISQMPLAVRKSTGPDQAPSAILPASILALSRLSHRTTISNHLCVGFCAH